MERGQRIGNSVLRQVVADRHLAAEAVASRRDAHLARIIRGGLHKHRHSKSGKPQSICHSAFVAKIWQSHDDAIDLISTFAKERSAPPGFLVRLDSAELGLFRSKSDGTPPGGLKGLEDLLATSLCRMIRKELPIPYDHSYCQLRFLHYFLFVLRGFELFLCGKVRSEWCRTRRLRSAVRPPRSRAANLRAQHRV